MKEIEKITMKEYVERERQIRFTPRGESGYGQMVAELKALENLAIKSGLKI